VNAWPADLVTALNAATDPSETWRHDNVGVSATGAAYWATNVGSILAPLKDNHVTALINLGVNDFGTATESTWKANMLTTADAIAARWPAAQVYVMRPWKRSNDTTANTYAGWIADLIAVRSFLHAGPDERIWLKGLDDGATMTTDGIHYNAAGEAEAVAQWRSVLGH
jgi:lysophospholipase L1-like esterase